MFFLQHDAMNHDAYCYGIERFFLLIIGTYLYFTLMLVFLWSCTVHASNNCTTRAHFQ